MRKLHTISGMSVKEAAELVGLSEGRIRQLIGEGEIKHERFGKSIVITPEGMKQLKARKTKPGPAPQASNGRKAA